MASKGVIRRGPRGGRYRVRGGRKVYLRRTAGSRVKRNPTYAQEMKAKYGVPFDPTRLKSVKGFRFGDRVMMTSRGEVALSGIPYGATGIVDAVATFGGHSISPDPTRRLIFVRWDKHGQESVFVGSIVKIGSK